MKALALVFKPMNEISPFSGISVRIQLPVYVTFIFDPRIKIGYRKLGNINEVWVSTL